jgi:dTDP-4-dehydrorhamnose reductase
LSTDFVFSGDQGTPYLPEQERSPLGVYGASKAVGERAVEQLLGGCGRGVILRTSWVMGPVGHNFALTMLRLHRERGAVGQPLEVVADQVSGPTSTHALAATCWRLLEIAPEVSVLHFCDAGAASWYDVAVAIGELAQGLGLLEQPAAVVPITSADWPTPARRPSYSLLACNGSRALLGLQPIHWRETLRQLLMQL